MIDICWKQCFLWQWSRINALIDFWKTDIWTVEYSIATTFRSTGTGSVLYWKYRTVYRTSFRLSVHFNPFISKDYGNFMNYVQLMTVVRPCTVFVRKCTILKYVTVAYRDISSQKIAVSFIFVKFELRPLWLYLPFQITDTWYKCALLHVNIKYV